MSSIPPFRHARRRLLAGLTATCVAGLAGAWPSLPAGAAPGVTHIQAGGAHVEGSITYVGGDPDSPANIAATAVTPAPGTLEVGYLSGSKTATTLDPSDDTAVTLSFPAEDFEPDYSIVLVADATASYATMAPQAAQLLTSLTDELVTRPNMTINVGAISYGTIGYDSFSPGSGGTMGVNGAVWGMLADGFRTGNWNMSLVPAGYQPLLAALTPLGPGWPADSMPTCGGGVTSCQHAASYVDLLGGLQNLTPATRPDLQHTMDVNGSRYAAAAMLVAAADMNTAPFKGTQNLPFIGTVTYQGYNMTNPIMGTNLEAGIKAGQALLDSDTTTPASNKYLVILTDGGTFIWDASPLPGSDPFKQLTGAGMSGTNITRGQPGSDWASANKASTPFLADLPGFMASVGATGTTPGEDATSQISVADWLAYSTDAPGFLAANPGASLTTSFSDRTTYPFVSLEKGVVHAAAALQTSIGTGEHVVMLGSPYNPGNPEGSAIAAMFMNWAASQLGGDYFAISPATQAADISSALDAVVGQMLYVVQQATLTDVIGPSFSLKMASSALSDADFDLTVGGVRLPGTPNGPDALTYGTPNAAGVAPYVLTYTDGVIRLQINVPVETAKPLQLAYGLHLNRDVTPGWHEDVPLNESAAVVFSGVTGAGVATFPVPVTAYFVDEPVVPPTVPPVNPVVLGSPPVTNTGGTPARAPWLLAVAGLMVAGAAVVGRIAGRTITPSGSQS